MSPVWPAHYQQEDSSPHHQVQPNQHLPYPPPISSPSQISQSWPAHSHPQYHQQLDAMTPARPQSADHHPQSQQFVAVGTPAEEQYAEQGKLMSDQKKRRKKKRKSRGTQPFECPEAPTSSDSAVIAQYREDYEAYLMREYGDFYTQFKADNQYCNS